MDSDSFVYRCQNGSPIYIGGSYYATNSHGGILQGEVVGQGSHGNFILKGYFCDLVNYKDFMCPVATNPPEKPPVKTGFWYNLFKY
jgi:hypothetical protein